MPHLGTSGFADPPLANVIVRDIYIYLYIYVYVRIYGVSSKHKQTSCWNETNSLSHHLLSLQKAMFQLHYPNDLIHIGQFSKLIDFLHTVYSVYMLHTCCIHVAYMLHFAATSAASWRLAVQSHPTPWPCRRTSGWRLVDCVCWDYLQGFCQTHTRRVTAIFNIF